MSGAVVAPVLPNTRVAIMHRFTEPTPTSIARGDLVEVFISDWEIECCAPPPVLGEPSSWTLEFISADRPHRTPELDGEHSWRVTCHDGLTLLTRGAITAVWSEVGGAPPAPGTVGRRGFLSGTVHGGVVPDGSPRTTGEVQRIRLVSQRFTQGADELVPVPGSFTMTDVARSPRWFRFDPPGPAGAGMSEVGVLVQMMVRAERPPQA